MHILLLTTSFPLTPNASSGVFVERLAQHLGTQCHLHVLAPASCEASQSLKNKMYQLSTFSYAPAKWQLLAHNNGGIPAALSANPWLWLLVPFFISSMILNCFWKARRAELIFANWSICGVVAGIIGLMLRRPVLTTLRGEDANRIESSLVHRFLVGFCLRLGGGLVTVSDDIANRVKILFPTMSAKVVMIPNGVNLLPVRNNYDARTENNKICLLMVGSLIPRKSVQIALHALASLPEEFLLTVVGDGSERESLISLASTLGLEKRVHFVGHIPPEQVSNWLAKADILVMTSRSEGRPNAVLEAMAASLPVVASDIPGHRELITSEINGKLFPVGNSDALVHCLLPLKDPVLRQQFGEASRHSIFERDLSWESTAERYLQQFNQLLAESKH